MATRGRVQLVIYKIESMCVCLFVPYALLNRSSDRRETLQSYPVYSCDGLCQTFTF